MSNNSFHCCYPGLNNNDEALAKLNFPNRRDMAPPLFVKSALNAFNLHLWTYLGHVFLHTTLFVAWLIRASLLFSRKSYLSNAFWPFCTLSIDNNVNPSSNNQGSYCCVFCMMWEWHGIVHSRCHHVAPKHNSSFTLKIHLWILITNSLHW